jgi:small subunit ribosomal protein S17
MSENSNTSERGIRKERTGKVTSNKMDKTIVVTVDRLARHTRYKKVIKISKKYYAHDENNDAKVGDEVKIAETRPTSKLKRWRLVEIQKVAE